MKVQKVIIIILIIILVWIAFLFFPYLFKNDSSIRELTKEELIEKPITYNFKICDSCKTLNDVLSFEMQKKSLQIEMDYQEYGTIFHNNHYGVTKSSYYQENDLFFLYDNPRTFIREIIHYGFSKEKPIIDSKLKLDIIEIKYFYKDDVVNKNYPHNNIETFSFKELESIFYQLSQSYRKPLSNNSFYTKDFSKYYNISKGYYGKSADYYDDKKSRDPIPYFEYSVGKRKKYFYTTSQRIPHLEKIVEYNYNANNLEEWDINISFNFSKSYIEKEPPIPSPLDYGVIYNDITDKDFAVFLRLQKNQI
jgi:hypothetical protein